MIRALLIALLALAVAPSGHAAETRAAPLVLAQVATPPAPDPHRLLPQEQARLDRNAAYETMAVVAVAGGAGALAAVLGGGSLTAMLVVGGAVGIVYLASGGRGERR